MSQHRTSTSPLSLKNQRFAVGPAEVHERRPSVALDLDEHRHVAGTERSEVADAKTGALQHHMACAAQMLCDLAFAGTACLSGAHANARTCSSTLRGSSKSN
jgi:hypothetical protein